MPWAPRRPVSATATAAARARRNAGDLHRRPSSLVASTSQVADVRKFPAVFTTMPVLSREVAPESFQRWKGVTTSRSWRSRLRWSPTTRACVDPRARRCCSSAGPDRHRLPVPSDDGGTGTDYRNYRFCPTRRRIAGPGESVQLLSVSRRPGSGPHRCRHQSPCPARAPRTLPARRPTWPGSPRRNQWVNQASVVEAVGHCAAGIAQHHIAGAGSDGPPRTIGRCRGPCNPRPSRRRSRLRASSPRHWR